MILHIYMQYFISCAILAAANLRVADAIDDEPTEIDAIAKAVGADTSCLLRLLRTLASIGIFREHGDRHFVHTARSAVLCSDHPAKEAAIVRMLGVKSMREAMVEYESAIKTGRSAYEIVHGVNPFDVIHSRPAEAAIYHEGMSVDGELISRILERCDFADIETIVDLGGGRGTLLARLLLLYPEKRGILLDLPEVVADSVLARYGVSERCEVRSGDLQADVPADGDAYILKNILHGRPDDDCVALLRLIGKRAGAKARVLVIENVMSDGGRLDFAKVFDLFLLLGGNRTRVRSEQEFRSLLDQSALEFCGITPLLQSQCLIEARLA